MSEYEDFIICLLTKTKASHNIPQSYHHTMATDLDRWIILMEIEMETLKAKHTYMGSGQTSARSEHNGVYVDIQY